VKLQHYLAIPPWEWPKSSAEFFLTFLNDHSADESDRLLAAELAGDSVVINEDLAEALLKIVSSPEEPANLRSAAAIALGPVLELAEDGEIIEDFDDVPISQATFEKIKDTLRKTFQDDSTPKEVQRHILEGSVRAPDFWHESAIAKAWESGDQEWVLTAVFAMNYVRGFDAQILEAVLSTNEDIRRNAIRAAGNWEITAAWPYIQPLFRDRKTPKPLLLAALGAAFGVCPEEAPEILGKFAHSKDDEMREAAEEALAVGPHIGEDDFEDEGDETAWVN
jgi:hypothetical protein